MTEVMASWQEGYWNSNNDSLQPWWAEKDLCSFGTNEHDQCSRDHSFFLILKFNVSINWLNLYRYDISHVTDWITALLVRCPAVPNKVASEVYVRLIYHILFCIHDSWRATRATHQVCFSNINCNPQPTIITHECSWCFYSNLLHMC